MKTTFDIPEPLLRNVQRLAKERGTTTKSLVEQALTRLLEQAQAGEQFQLVDRSIAGNGLQVEFAEASWDRIRDVAYGEGR